MNDEQKLAILRSHIKNVLISEGKIVTMIDKDFNEEIYDVDFDNEGNIVSGKKLGTNTQNVMNDALKIARQNTIAPAGKIFEAINSFEPTELLRPLAGSAENVAEIMNKMGVWGDTLAAWVPKDRRGRGEAQVKIVFKESPSKGKEPDFLSPDGVALSIKYFGADAKGVARTGDSETTSISVPTRELFDTLGLSYSQSDVTSVDIISSLNVIKYSGGSQKSSAQEDPDAPEKLQDNFVEVLEKCSGLLENIKAGVINEHKANAILGCDPINGFYAITSPSQIGIKTIRKGRIEIYGPKNTSMMTFEKAIQTFYLSRKEKSQLRTQYSILHGIKSDEAEAAKKAVKQLIPSKSVTTSKNPPGAAPKVKR